MTVAGRKLSYNPASGTMAVLLEKEILSKDNLDQSSQGYLAYLEKIISFAGKPGQVKQVTTDGSTRYCMHHRFTRANLELPRAHSGATGAISWLLPDGSAHGARLPDH